MNKLHGIVIMTPNCWQCIKLELHKIHKILELVMWKMLLKVHIKVVEINLSELNCCHKIINEVIFILSKFVQILHFLKHRQHTCQSHNYFHITKQFIVSGNNWVSRKILGHFHNNKLLLRYLYFRRGQHWDPLCLNVFQKFQTPWLSQLGALQMFFGGLIVVNVHRRKQTFYLRNKC